MKTRIIYTKFWHDNYISELNIKEKLLFIYLTTNDQVNICGIYELPDRYIKFDLGLKQSELDKMKNKFINDKKFIFIDGWIKIINHDIYNKFVGEKNNRAKEKEMALIPIKIRDFVYPIEGVSTFGDTSNNHNKNINKKEGVVGGDKKVITEVIKYLNEKADKSYLPGAESHQKYIKARLKEGYLLSAFKWVIDIKCNEWKDTDMDKYLRPETLFGNKFEGYLNQSQRGEQ